MGTAYGVVAIYLFVVVWVLMLVRDFKQQSFTSSVVFGIALLLYLNVRYFIHGLPDGIAFFVSIYSVADNLGLDASQTYAALARCPDNACSIWGDRYVYHPSWGVAFHERFLNSSELASLLLYTHIGFNSLVFVLMHVQLARPGTAQHKDAHRLLGKITFACLTVATVSAIIMSAQHGSIDEYGGNLSTYGFYSMSFVVYGCAVMGVVAAKRGDHAMHRIWMIRFIGAMWGSFWLFRLMLLITGPLFRQWETVSLLISIWLSAPLGVLIAEVMRKQLMGWRRNPHLVS